MLNKKILLKIKELGIKTDWSDAFGGKSKGNKHLFRVVILAKYMAKKLGANIAIVEAGAWLHDTALPSGNDYDYEKNKVIIKNLLLDFDLSKEDLYMIVECVASHEGTSEPQILESKIVHDADVLEKTGILGIIRHTWKLVNSGKLSPECVTNEDVKEILKHLKWRSNKLQTSLGKKISRYLSLPITTSQARAIISIVAKEAFKGVVTEKIARLVYKKLTVFQKRKLQEQLNLDYISEFI